MEPKLGQSYKDAAQDLIIFMSGQDAPNYTFYAGSGTTTSFASLNPWGAWGYRA